MKINLCDSLEARLRSASSLLWLPPEELLEWLLADGLKRIESSQVKSTPEERAEAIRAKIAAAPLLIVEDLTKVTLASHRRD